MTIALCQCCESVFHLCHLHGSMLVAHYYYWTIVLRMRCSNEPDAVYYILPDCRLPSPLRKKRENGTESLFYGCRRSPHPSVSVCIKCVVVGVELFGGMWRKWMKRKLNNGAPYPVININFLFEWGKFCQFNCVDGTARIIRMEQVYYYTDLPHHFPTHKTWCMQNLRWTSPPTSARRIYNGKTFSPAIFLARKINLYGWKVKMLWHSVCAPCTISFGRKNDMHTRESRVYLYRIYDTRILRGMWDVRFSHRKARKRKVSNTYP